MSMIDKVRPLVESGVVNARRHESLPLTIYNYSPRCQYEKLWCPVSLQCRGLILDDAGNVVAKPFPKFFNDTEHTEFEIPWNTPCEITEKMDGSLLIVFNFGGKWHAATRGSFDSEQSVKGMDILQRKYDAERLDPAVTYLFEVIYPGNRIVIDYGSREDVVLLGMIRPNSGVEMSLDFAPAGLTVVRRLPMTASALELRSIIRDDEEGYVVRFANGFRIKIKGAKYMELHRIMTGLSSRGVWELLANGKSVDSILDVVPDEFAEWVKRQRDNLQGSFMSLVEQAQQVAAAVASLPTRKDKAIRIMADAPMVAPLVFSMLDGKNFDAAAWKMVYPELSYPIHSTRLNT